MQSKLRSENQINSLKYFTAYVTNSPQHPNCHVHQQIYLRALKRDNVEVIRGHFISGKKKMPLASRPQRLIEVLKTEEKGSDVNLASHLLADASRGRFEVAVVISGDSDLLTPIRLVKNELRKKVIVFNPREVDSILKRNCSYYKCITEQDVVQNQFNYQLTDSNGTFFCPLDWR